MTSNQIPEYWTTVCWFIVSIPSPFAVGLPIGFYIPNGLRYLFKAFIWFGVVISALVLTGIVSDADFAVNSVSPILDALASAVCAIASSLPLSSVSIASAASHVALGVLLRELKRPRATA